MKRNKLGQFMGWEKGKIPESVKEKIRKANTGKHPTAETIIKLKESHLGKKGEKASDWKGGIIIKEGRVFIYSPKHPLVRKLGYVARYRLIAEKCIGRYLTKEEVIHHINGIPNDDRPENLYLFSSKGEHTGYENIPVNKINIKDALKGEYDENTIRKNFKPSEKVAIWGAMEEYHGNRFVESSESDGSIKRERASKALKTSHN